MVEIVRRHVNDFDDHRDRANPRAAEYLAVWWFHRHVKGAAGRAVSGSDRTPDIIVWRCNGGLDRR